MFDIAGTIPVSPAHADKLGFYSLFIYTNELARSKQVQAVYAINSVGKPDADTMLSKLQSSVHTLGVNPLLWWNDLSLNEQLVSSRAGEFLERRVVQESVREINRCACGNVEYLGGAVLLGNKKTLVRNGYAACCKSRITSQEDTVILTAPLLLVRSPVVFPSWASRELNAVLETLEGCQLLVSRRTKRLHRLYAPSGACWELDNDILWWLYTQWLRDAGMNLRHLIVGASVIRQTGVLLALSALFGAPVPESIHCLPKVLFKPVHGIETLEQATIRFGRTRVTNALLWAALSERKEFILSGSMFPDMCGTSLRGLLTTASRSLLRRTK